MDSLHVCFPILVNWKRSRDIYVAVPELHRKGALFCALPRDYNLFKQTDEGTKQWVETRNDIPTDANPSMKIPIGSHVREFDLLQNGKLTQYDRSLAETDLEILTVEIDIGRACIAGQNVSEMIKESLGR